MKKMYETAMINRGGRDGEGRGTKRKYAHEDRPPRNP